MLQADITKDKLLKLIDQMSELDFGRFAYCQEIAGTYLAVRLFEDMLVTAMHMCDRVKVEEVLGRDKTRWEQSLQKKALLEGSTLGTLIKILKRHNIAAPDIRYLKWIKDRRDYFIHRLFGRSVARGS